MKYMEVEMKSAETKSTMTTTKMEEADEKKKTKEQLIGLSLGQGHDPETEFLRQIPEETPREESLMKNSETEMMMKMKDDKNLGENPDQMIKEGDQKENFRQTPEKNKKEDQEESFRQDPEEKRQENNNNMNYKTTKPHVWDCGSTLYDSFELNSFKRQLDSAISASSARTMSMPHLPNRRLPPSIIEEAAPPPQPQRSSGKKSSNKFSRSLQKLLKSVFKPKQQHTSSAPSSPAFRPCHGGDVDRYYVVFDKSESLTTIPELAETEVGPDISSLVRKTASERFTAARLVGISCA